MTYAPPPLADRIAEALIAAAYSCDGTDCRATEDECEAAHPVRRPAPWRYIVRIEGSPEGLAAAVLAVVQPELDRLTTAFEVVTTQCVTAQTARDRAVSAAKVRTDIADAELRTLRAAVRDGRGDPVQVQNLYAQLNLRTRQWKRAQAGLDARDAENTRLRAELAALTEAAARFTALMETDMEKDDDISAVLAAIRVAETARTTTS
ncbi:hypothetical protein ACIQC7_27765 [Kitasatospora sp. NPDC088556]|uniref:hypothetical protein n=1 Tax=Kitasatospora sp. NPDC088556 TaxID=3364076 RepID=UPI003821577A